MSLGAIREALILGGPRTAPAGMPVDSGLFPAFETVPDGRPPRGAQDNNTGETPALREIGTNAMGGAGFQKLSRNCGKC